MRVNSTSFPGSSPSRGREGEDPGKEVGVNCLTQTHNDYDQGWNPGHATRSPVHQSRGLPIICTHGFPGRYVAKKHAFFKAHFVNLSVPTRIGVAHAFMNRKVQMKFAKTYFCNFIFLSASSYIRNKRILSNNLRRNLRMFLMNHSVR